MTIGTWSTDQKTYSFDTGSSFIQATDAQTPSAGGSITFFISGAQDTANRVMDGDPKTIAYADATGHWHGYEPATPDMYHVIQIATVTPTPTQTSNGSPTDTPQPTATIQTPTATVNYTASKFIDPDVFGPYSNIHERDANGNIVWAGPDFQGDGNFYIAVYDVKAHQDFYTKLDSSFGDCLSFDVSPDGRIAAAGLDDVVEGNITFDGSVVELSNEGESSGQVYPTIPASSQASIFESNLVFDSQDNLYALENQDFYVEDFSNAYLIEYEKNGLISTTPLIKGGSRLIRDGNWNVQLEVVNPDGSTSFQPLAWANPAREDWKKALADGLDRLLGPDQAWAGLSFFNNIAPENQVPTGDGRVYVLQPDGQTVVGYDLNADPLCQFSISEGANDTFLASIISYVPGESGSGGTLVFVDDFGDAREFEIPLPPGFTPSPTATSTNSFTPTLTFTPTVTPTPTPSSTVTSTSTPTPTNLNGSTSTFTLTPSPTSTATFTGTPTPFLTFTPTFTPNADGYADWLEGENHGAFGQRAGQPMLFFNNQLWVIGGNSPNESAGGLSGYTDVWSSVGGVSWTQTTANAGLAPGEGPFIQGTVLGGKMWVAGPSGDVWNSSDGADWIETTGQAPWVGRQGFTLTAFGGQLWVIGGLDAADDSLNDIWSSTDGINWVSATLSAPFQGRYNHQTLVFGGQLWVMGGQDFLGDNFNDVWNSTNGVNWTQVTPGAPWGPRYGFMAGVDVNSQLFVMGGGNVDPDSGVATALNDVWHSPDGVNWVVSTYNAPFSPRAFAGICVAPGGAPSPLGGHTWMTGGDPLTVSCPSSENCIDPLLADVWYSNSQAAPTFTPMGTPTPDVNGQWVEAVSQAGFSPRTGAGAACFNPSTSSGPGGNQLWLVGGNNPASGPLGEVWNSTDGVNWSLATNNTPWDEQDQLVCVVFQNKLWAFNALDYSTDEPTQQVYNSPDGVNWNLVTASTPFNLNDFDSLLAWVLNGRVWVLVNATNCATVSSAQLFSSADGVNWRSEPWILGERSGAAYAVYQGKIWIFGGSYCAETDISRNDVVNSADGVNWTTVLNDAPMTISNNYQAAVAGNVLYLVGNGLFSDESVNPGSLSDQWATTDGFHWTRVSAQLPFGPRDEGALVSMNGRLFMAGGQDSNGNAYNDVWTAPAAGFTPATTWTPTGLIPSPTFTSTVSPTPTGTGTMMPTASLTASLTPALTPTPTFTTTPSFTVVPVTGQGWLLAQATGYSSRTGQAAAAFNGSLWVMGGRASAGLNSQGILGDIWNSADGVNWNLVSPQGAFGARTEAAAVSFNNHLWVFGGQGVTVNSNGATVAEPQNDVWSSADGVSWTQAVASAPWPARSGHQVVVLNNQLYLMGGINTTQNIILFNDVWSSPDGVNWTQVTASAAFNPRYDFGATALNNQLFVIGGDAQFEKSPQNDVWVSPDGKNWSEAVTNAPFEARSEFGVCTADGKIWVLGGLASSGAVKNDVWHSCDGAGWSEDVQQAGFSAREGLSSLAFGPSTGNLAGVTSLWVIGGLGLSGNGKDNTWYSPTGNDQPCVALAPTSTPTPSNGLYANWVEATSHAGFPPRADHASVTFQNAMWVLGGGDDNQFYNDAWSSADGASWSQATASAGFSPRIGHGAAVFNGQMWVIGGQNIDESLDNDVWSSPDGAHWTQTLAQAPFSPRTGMSVFVENGQLWVAGGLDANDDVLNDTWSSPDGVTWTQQHFNRLIANAFPSRAYQAGAQLNGTQWVVGGVGNDGSLLGDVWSSSDGPDWISAASPGFTAREDATLASFDNMIFMAGGMSPVDVPLGDVWYSSNGSTWNLATNSAAFNPRSDHTSVAFNPSGASGPTGNKLWVIGGWDGNEYLNDVWYVNSLIPTPTATPTANTTPVPTLACPLVNSIPVSQPLALALDGSGNLYAADNENGQVDIFNPGGSAITHLGGTGSAAGFIFGDGVAVDPAGKIYVADYVNNQVDVFDSQYHFANHWNQAPAGTTLSSPGGIAVDANGRVYVADFGNSAVEVYNNGGAFLSQVGNGVLSGPSASALDGAGNLYVSDFNLESVFVFNSQGNLVRQWSTYNGLSGANYIAIDDTNNLVYVSDALGDVGVYDEFGDLIGVFQGPGAGFNNTQGLAIGNGVWYVADFDNNVVDEFSSCSLNGVPISSPPTTPTSTATWTPSATLTPAFTPTETYTATSTATSSFTPTTTNTSTSTASPSPTATFTPSSTTTPTNTSTDTFTPTWTPTNTGTLTNTATLTDSTTPTPSATGTPTATASPTSTATNTYTVTPTATPTCTDTATNTPTASATKTTTSTATNTRTASITPALTPSPTPTATASPTKTFTSAGAPTKTSTKTTTSTPTRTATKTSTGTKTLTPTITPTPTPTVQCGTDNTHLALLEEYTSSCGSNTVFHLFEVVNSGSPVTLSDLTIKFWPYDTSGVALVGQIATGGCLWNPTCSHNITGVSMSAVNFSPACGPTTNQMANWEMTLSTTDNTVLSGGTSWVNLETLVSRSDSQPFVPGTSHWYSQCVMTTTYSVNSHYAIYLKGNLVTSSGGVPPSCRPLPTCTPHTGGMAPLEEGTGERPTGTLTPVPTNVPASFQFVGAAPNVSRNGEPIRFLVNLNNPSQVDLSVYALTGEKVFEAETLGQAGQNILTWNLQNEFQETVASGLYIYMVQMEEGGVRETKWGRVAVLR